jgi:hypothetical protein
LWVARQMRWHAGGGAKATAVAAALHDRLITKT